MTDQMNDNEEDLPDHPLQALHDELENHFGADASIADGEEPEAWYERMQHEGRLYATSRTELKDIRKVKEMKAAEAAGTMIHIQDDDETTDSASPLGAPRAEHLRTLKPEDRLAAYRSENATQTK